MRTPPTSTLFVALALAACSSAPPAPSAPAPAGPAAQVATAPAADGASQSRFGGEPAAPPTLTPTSSPAPSSGPAATPAPTPVPTPLATPSGPPPMLQQPWDPSQGGARMIAFASTRVQGGQGAFDVYLFDPATATVYAIPAANTIGNEINPSLSSSGRWMVFASNFRGNYDLVRYDLEAQVMDPLATLNTTDDELAPSIDDSGNVIAYLGGTQGQAQIRVFDLATGLRTAPPALAAMAATVSAPQVSGDGRWLAFSATDANGADVYLYHVGDTAVNLPPYINTPADEVDPWLSADGLHLLFASNRRGGSYDLYEADLGTNMIADLQRTASAGNEREPRYMGATGQDIVFASDRTVYENRLMLYHHDTGIVDSLPLLHEPGEDAIRGSSPVTPAAGDGAGAGLDFFGFGNLYNRNGRGSIFGGRTF